MAKFFNKLAKIIPTGKKVGIGVWKAGKVIAEVPGKIQARRTRIYKGRIEKLKSKIAAEKRLRALREEFKGLKKKRSLLY